MKYQLFDSLTPEEFAMLEKDCLERGIMVPIEVDEKGNVLDGHHRLEIAEKHDLAVKRVVRRFNSEAEKKTHVIMLNMARRHLTPLKWGLAFRELLEVKGVKRKSGRPRKEENTATVAELAEELGVPQRTAEHRTR